MHAPTRVHPGRFHQVEKKLYFVESCSIRHVWSVLDKDMCEKALPHPTPVGLCQGGDRGQFGLAVRGLGCYIWGVWRGGQHERKCNIVRGWYLGANGCIWDKALLMGHPPCTNTTFIFSW